MSKRSMHQADWEESIYSLPMYNISHAKLTRLTQSLQQRGHFRLIDIQNLKQILEITFELGKAEERKRHIE